MPTYNNPALGAVFDNLAALFRPPSGSDAAGWANAAAVRERAARERQLYEFFTGPEYDPSMRDRYGLGAGAWTPSQSFEMVGRGQDMDSADRRYGVDVGARTSLATNTADNARAMAVARLQEQGALDRQMLDPVAAGATRFVPPSIAGLYGVPDMQIGAVSATPGERVTLPDGRMLEGAPKPMSETEWMAREGAALRSSGVLDDPTMLALLFGSTPLETVQTLDGPRLTTRPAAIGAAPPAGARPLTPEERAAYALPSTTPAYAGPDGKPAVLGGNGPTVNVHTGTTGKLREKLDENQGKAWSDALDAATLAGAATADLDMLAELATMAPQGPVIGRLAAAFPGISAAGDAFQSIINRVAPSLRVPGSGATSDVEYQGMVRSLPSLANQPEANRAIVAMMRAKADLNIRRGEIVTAYQDGRIDDAEARRRLGELNRVSILTPALRRILGEVAPGSSVSPGSSPAAPSPAETAPASPPTRAGPSADVPTPQSQADYDALPSGAVFRDPEDGRLYRKP